MRDSTARLRDQSNPAMMTLAVSTSAARNWQLGFPILAAKLRPPLIEANHLPRHALLQQLAAWQQGRLVAITAPAGYGKTTLAASFVQQVNQLTPQVRTVWLTLDEDDDDPVRFLACFTAALAPLIPAAAEQAALVLYQGQERQALLLLLAALETLAQPVLIALDDFQRIGSPAVHQLLDLALARGPDNLHFVITSRHALPLALGKLRAAGRLLALEAEHLRLQRTEIEAFVALNSPLPWDSAALDLLEERTLGWAAGLKLALLSQKGPPSAATLPAHVRGDSRYLAEYLTDEVLAHLSQEMRSFLLECAILPRLQADLCAAVTERTNCAQLLEQAAAEHLFLSPQDSIGEWYELHQLFRELLQRQLEQRYPAHQVAALHLRAANWRLAHNDIPAAIRHCLAGGAPDRAIVIVQERSRQALLQGYRTELQHWVELLAEAPLDDYPQLLLDLAWLEAPNLNAALQQHVACAQAAVAALPQPPAAWRDESAVLQLLARAPDAGRRPDYPEVRAQLALLEEHSSLARGWCNMAVLLVGAPDSPEELYTSIAQAADDFAAAGYADGETMVLTARAAINFHRGSAALVIADYEQAMRARARQARPNLGYLAEMAMLAGQACYWCNRLDAAIPYFQHWLEIGRLAGAQLHVSGAQIWLQLCTLAQGGAAPTSPAQQAAEADLLRELAAHSNLATNSIFIYSLMLRALAQGLRGDAWRHFQQLGVTLEMLPNDAPEILTQATLMAYVVAGRQLEHLPAVINRALARSRAAHYALTETHLTVLLAIQQQQMGRQGQARATVRQALRLVEQTGCSRIVLLYPELLPLLRSEHVRSADRLAAQMVQERSSSSHAQLTAQERQVLDLLAQEQSIQAIADQLVLSPATVKWHLGNIYKKLGVKGRREAITLVRQEGQHL